MFRLTACRLLLPTAVGGVALAEQQTTRGFATLKDISIRLKSIKNIQKITKSMKMVSAAKYAKAERELKAARVYGEGAQVFFNNIDVGKALVASEAGGEQAASGKTGNKKLLVLMTSDRGLCGAVHSSVSKAAKAILNAKSPDEEIKLICSGDKSKQVMQRVFSQHILLAGNEYGRAPPTFVDASRVAKAILDSGYQFDEGHIIFNRFKTVVSYETQKLPIVTLEAVKENQKLLAYDSVDDDVLRSYVEYSLAQLIYYAMKESATSEQSSRMTAMDGASKNAGEMITSLTMQFNRTRQAVITRELIEIISGAACV